MSLDYRERKEEEVQEQPTVEKDPITSTSDRRVENNVMRHEYKVLSEFDKSNMQNVKDCGLAFHELLTRIGDYPREAGCAGGSRELSLAKTKIEEAVMWAVKHITK